MDLRVKHSLETRIEVARLFDAGFGYKAVAAHLGLKGDTVRHWQDRYLQGRLLDSTPMKKKFYSAAVKVAAVEKFLAGTSKTDVVAEFQISNRGMLSKWVATYREFGPDGLLPKAKGRPRDDSRPETLEQRLAFLEMENEILKKWVALAQEEDRRLSGL
jgi:transposase-like protein